MAFHAFTDDQGNTHGSFETFRHAGGELCGDDFDAGWYWWCCFPGCLPDSDYPSGPFQSEQEAIADANGEG